ncbi:TrkH family potassium uptake protein [Halonotius pteroides]|uniref:TrkH family potassium uptake protein n=1 Tax=Halonotius pteroides TaxID=268735 RepID=A0A3A6Q4Z5_9EURY|nr:TrkH family potassium uptake protein [Halonotius pteroides]RJX49492.1 TrkH family potassium uptake protein [Halonotius pteroides]
MVTLRVNWRVSLRLLGGVLKWLALPLAAPLGLAVIDGDPTAPFLVPIVITLAAGLGLERLETDTQLYTREAYLMVALSWLCVGLIGAVPFVLAGNGGLATPINAVFESMSGITTTGATVIDDFAAHSRAILLWRQVIQWLGGLGILVLAISILSQLAVGGAQLMETESQTQDVHKLTPRISETARLIWWLYAGVTLFAAGGLFALGLAGIAPNMDAFNAVSHAMTAVATAGFSPQPDSVGAFAPAAQWLIVPFMFVGATNFILIYFFINGDLGRPLRNEEFRFYLGLVVGASVLMGLLLVTDPTLTTTGVEETARLATFQVVSLLTTTGFATVDFNAWSPAAKHLLFSCMFLGGMAGSTTCSIKLLRWLIILKSFRRDLFTTIHPEAVRPVRLSGTAIDEETIRDVFSYTMLSLVIFFLGTIVVVVDGARIGLELSEFEALSAAAATFFNIGPAFGVAGPFNSYSPFSELTKAVMILLMYVGRIEIIPVLVLFTPSFWRS